ncbi:TonB-dependent receptor plug domain-containing protein [Candidatus Thioglobus autotrophicus]|uniref:TonB-dependent receptor plug domain-containing protein n=1 Tax=Candidatus Thioglobus autotrophicus TaxID=1705394 RepID=UPI00299E2D26|nr:TonB-dependent receptor [Candidatus Thioglobus autotrophicus]WPE18634.1 TonB-dependent receptor [Candidatus Thioglobus autotrophicus]
MKLKQLSLVAAISALTFTTTTNAVLGPIPIYLNTEYRTDSPVIGSIASTLSFDAEDIKATGANTFLDFLATVPSVGLFNGHGNVPAVFMRGGHSNHTLILVDGIKINSASSQNGAAEYGLANVALNDIEKIEIVKGSGSVLYGAQAVSGVINITTKKGADSTRSAISMKYGTHNSKTYDLSVSGGSVDGFVRFSHNKYTTDGIDARDADTTNDKDGVDNRTTQIKFGNEHYHVTYLESRLKNEYDRCWDGTQSVDNCLGDTKLNKVLISTNKKINNTWNAKLSLAQITDTRDETKGSVFTLGDQYKRTDITLLNDIKIDEALLNIGLSQVDDKNTNNNQQITSKEAFINWQKKINSIDINTGARYIEHSKFNNETVYNLGIAKHLDKGVKLTSTYSTAFTTPSLAQINAVATLEPETSKNIELGIEKTYDWGMVDVRTYTNKIENAFRSDATTSWIWTNIGRLTTKGIEVSANTNINNYDLNFSHGYNKSRAHDETTQAIRRPKKTTNLTLSKQYAKFNSKMQIIKKSSSLDAGNIELAGYTLLNLSTQYQVNNNTKASLTVNNATNKDYTVANGFNQFGRTVSLGLDYNF